MKNGDAIIHVSIFFHRDLGSTLYDDGRRGRFQTCPLSEEFV